MLRSIELFSGAGGLALGVHQAGFRNQALFELDEQACLTLRQNIGKRAVRGVSRWRVIQKDVRELDFSSYQGIDLIAGGSPCQPFSHAGKRKGRHDERDMIPEFIRAVREAQPRAFVLENVRGLANSKFADYLAYVRLQLRFIDCPITSKETWQRHHKRLLKLELQAPDDAVYDVHANIVNTADYGIPQSRHRLFIVGFRRNLGIKWSFPKPTHSLDALLHDQYVSKTYWRRHGIARIPQAHSRYKARIEVLRKEKRPKLKAWRTIRDAIADLPKPTAARSAVGVTQHQVRPGARVYDGHTGSGVDLPSKTLKAGRHGVPGGENVVVWPNGKYRYFTIREAARFQCFPDEWQFTGGWVAVIRQLGNAVPPAMASIVLVSVSGALRRAVGCVTARRVSRHSVRKHKQPQQRAASVQHPRRTRKPVSRRTPRAHRRKANQGKQTAR